MVSLYIVNEGQHFIEDFESDAFNDFKSAFLQADKKYPNATFIFKNEDYQTKFMDTYYQPILFKTGNKRKPNIKVGFIIRTENKQGGMPYYNMFSYFIYSQNKILYINHYDTIGYFHPRIEKSDDTSIYTRSGKFPNTPEFTDLNRDVNEQDLYKYISDNNGFGNHDKIQEYRYLHQYDSVMKVMFTLDDEQYIGHICQTWDFRLQQFYDIQLYSGLLQKSFYFVHCQDYWYFINSESLTIL